MATAFSKESYLKDWKERQIFPRIHDDMFRLFSSTFTCSSVLDMCSCTGLLGVRIRDFHGVPVVGLEGNLEWIDRGKKWGVDIETLNCWIGPKTLPVVDDFMKQHKVDGIVARRCLAELFGYGPDGKLRKGGPDYEWAETLTKRWVQLGVKEIWIEGGKPMRNPESHPVPNTDIGITCFSPAYELAERYRECAYLIARDNAI